MKKTALVVVIALVMCNASQACAGGLGKLLFAIVQRGAKAAVTSAPTATKAAVKTAPATTKVTAAPAAGKAAVESAPAAGSNFAENMAAFMGSREISKQVQCFRQGGKEKDPQDPGRKREVHLPQQK